MTRAHIEHIKFQETKKILVETLPKQTLDWCGFNLDLKKPETRANENMTKGVFFPEGSIVLYPKGQYNSLVHEYMHAFVFNGLRGPVSRDCLNEVVSAYAARIDRLLKENRRLRENAH